MAELHLENAARVLQRILNARDRDQTWIVEVGPAAACCEHVRCPERNLDTNLPPIEIRGLGAARHGSSDPSKGIHACE